MKVKLLLVVLGICSYGLASADITSGTDGDMNAPSAVSGASDDAMRAPPGGRGNIDAPAGGDVGHVNPAVPVGDHGHAVPGDGEKAGDNPSPNPEPDMQ